MNGESLEEKAISRRRRVRHAVEILVSGVLFSFQHIPVWGPWLGSMVFPLIMYVLSLMWAHPDFFRAEIALLLLHERLMFGRMIAVAGFVILSTACVQFLLEDRSIIKTGLYSLVRHPQYLGILVMTLGLTIMCIQFTGGAQRTGVGTSWVLQGLGYISLAAYEEHCLLGEHKEEYQRYRQRIPFIFPLPNVPRIFEPLISIISTLSIAFLLILVT